MRVLVIEPGPNFSVQDVANGWYAGLSAVGCEVVQFNLSDRLTFYSAALLEKDGEYLKAFDPESAIRLAAQGIESAIYRLWPHVVIVVSAFVIPGGLLTMMRARGHKVVFHGTESPYESDRELEYAPMADLVLLNDPTDIDRFRQVNTNTHYMPHAYDPAVHYRRPPSPDLKSDFAFCGTAFPSRVEFFEAVDWSGIDVALAGNWNSLGSGSPLLRYLVHDLDGCFDNRDTVDLYCSTKASANLYRTEAQRPELSAGWAMGPREVELAACGTFFLRDHRPEGDEVFPMLPTFDGTVDFADKLRWWLAHDDQRDEAARLAQQAIADRTFAANAQSLMRLLNL